jgi:uncharacterized protein YgiM (DUF1202 family)
MSDPRPTPPDRPAPAPRPAPPRPARWLSRISAALLLAAAALTAWAAAPALLRATGTSLPRTEPLEGAPPPLDLRHGPPEILANPEPTFEPDHEDDDAPGPAAAPGAHLGFARGPLALRARPGEASKPVGEVAAGDLVMIMRESGDWALVWAGGTDSMLKGWARKSGIALR